MSDFTVFKGFLDVLNKKQCSLENWVVKIRSAGFLSYAQFGYPVKCLNLKYSYRTMKRLTSLGNKSAYTMSKAQSMQTFCHSPGLPENIFLSIFYCSQLMIKGIILKDVFFCILKFVHFIIASLAIVNSLKFL